MRQTVPRFVCGPVYAGCVLCIVTGGALAATKKPSLDLCHRMLVAAERLNCYDAATDYEVTDRPISPADLIKEGFRSEPSPPKPKPKADAPKEPLTLKEQLSVRSSPKIAADNKEAALMSIASAQGRTAGSASAAVLWVQEGGLAAVTQTGKAEQTWYGALGAKVDRTNTDRSKHTSTQDYRFGHYRVFKARGERDDGVIYSRDLSIVGKNDDVKYSHNFALEADFAWDRRWALYKPPLDLLLRDTSVIVGVTPFLDRGVKGSTKGQNSRGLELRIGASTSAPKSWVRKEVGEGLRLTLTPKEFSWRTEWVKSAGDVDQFSTLHKLGLSWSLTDPDVKRTSQGLKLSRSVGAHHRDGIAPENKTTLSFEWKYN